MAKQNNKIYGNIGFSRLATKPYVVVLDICTGYSFIGNDVIHIRMWDKIKLSWNTNVRNTHTSKDSTSGPISLAVET